MASESLFLKQGGHSMASRNTTNLLRRLLSRVGSDSVAKRARPIQRRPPTMEEFEARRLCSVTGLTVECLTPAAERVEGSPIQFRLTPTTDNGTLALYYDINWSSTDHVSNPSREWVNPDHTGSNDSVTITHTW